MTTLRNVIGGMALEKTLTSRDEINNQLRGVLDEATGKWGIRVNRVELKAIDPPASIQETMEKQMRADREKRAAILTAEGVKQSQILTAEGEKQAAILQGRGPAAGDDPRGRGPGEGDRHRLQGDPRRATPTRSCSPTSTCRCCRRSRRATPNKMWIIPSELTQALGGSATSGKTRRRRADPAHWREGPLRSSPTGSLHIGNALGAVANRNFGGPCCCGSTQRAGTSGRRGGDPRDPLARDRVGRGAGASERAGGALPGGGGRAARSASRV